VVAVVASVGAGLSVGLLAGWAVVAAINVVWLLSVVWPMDAEQTRSHTTSVDPGRPVARLIALAGSVASLGGVVAVLIGSGSSGHARAFLVAGVAIAAVVSSWALIQVDYMLRYARVYYASPRGWRVASTSIRTMRRRTPTSATSRSAWG
jgi:uncharacterized membrane protein